jgi:putative oligomerization/nucleic acid binding protein
MMRRRGGPGILSTMARTAVIAGTATAVSNKVNARAAGAAQQRQAHAQASAAQGELAQVKEQLTALQAQQAETTALGEGGAMLAQLQQLAEMRESGILTDEEFSAAKARLLAG